MKISAEFVTSVAVGGTLPPACQNIVALVGRSNVGKSSLINILVKQKIARSGSTPGTTRLLNVYRVDVSSRPRGTTTITLVDLPGYGYARGGARAQREFDQLTTGFFAETRLQGALLVVDARHPGLETDLAAYRWLAAQSWPVLVVATKGDRLSRNARLRAHKAHETALGASVLPVSSKTGEGAAALWAALTRLVTA